jgi:hypothetical protein
MFSAMDRRDRFLAWLADFPSGPADTLLLVTLAGYVAVILAQITCALAGVPFFRR